MSNFTAGVRYARWALAGVACVALGCQVSLPSASGASGSAVPVPVTWQNPNANVSAIMFGVAFDPATVSLAFSIGDQPQAAGKTIYSAEVSPGLRRFVLAGTNAAIIPDGTLVNLTVTILAGAPAGTSPLAVSGLMCAASDGSESPGASTDGAITIQNSIPAQVLTGQSILNSATMQSGPIAPGEAITILGSQLAAQNGTGTSVTFDGAPGQVLLAQPAQLNAVVPGSIAGPRTVVRIFSGSALVASTAALVSEVSPGIFTQNYSGTGAAVALNEDGTVNSASNPAARGSTISVFVNGLGNADPSLAGADPTPAPPQLRATIARRSAPVISIGSTPGSPAAVRRVQLSVPAEIDAGPAVPIIISQSGVSTQSGVTVSVR